MLIGRSIGASPSGLALFVWRTFYPAGAAQALRRRFVTPGERIEVVVTEATYLSQGEGVVP
jgi:hypothetical protein